MELLISTSGAYDISYGVVQNGTAQNAVFHTIIPTGFDESLDKYWQSILTAKPTLIEPYILTDNELLEIEKKIFEANKDKYLDEYEGKHIALMNGVVLDFDNVFSNLAKRVYEKYGYKAIFMPLVTKKRSHHILPPKLKRKKSI